MSRKPQHSAAGRGNRKGVHPAPEAPAVSARRVAEQFAEALGHHQAGRLAEAERLYRQIWAIDPNHADSLHLLGLVARQQGRNDAAVELIGRAVALRPDFAEARNNLANALRDLGRLEEAEAGYREALRLKPDYADAHNNLGNALKDLGRVAEAEACYREALRLKPDYAEAHGNLGVVFQDQGKLAEAVACYEQALKLKPDFVAAYNNLGMALKIQGKREAAVECCERALALAPDNADARFALCMAQLPILYRDVPEIAERRAAYARHLMDFCEDTARTGRYRELAAGVGSSQPFYLAYQGECDRELQSLYGALVCRIMAESTPAAPLPPPPAPNEPVRVGIVSGYFRHHSNWKVPIRGWLARLDRRHFRLFGYHTGTRTDAETKAAAGLCERFVQGPLSLENWRRAIGSDAPHVLIYPEVGMDPVSVRLAAQRLAPVQCTSWGHPDTSGFPTLDYFISSEMMEPPDGEEHYSERLVRLPNLSIYYEPPPKRPLALGRAALGLRRTATVYWCAQSLSKYLPQFDQVFARIAREAGDCQFAFIQNAGGEHVNGMFRERLERAFAACGLRAADHAVLLPQLERDRFAAAAGLCDIVLDSIGWSGCNSSLESLDHDLPIVTLPGTLMRGRHTMAILKMMAVEETIAATLDDYVRIAVRLARDLPWRMAVKRRIAQGKQQVYRDGSPIAALAAFLERVGRPGTAERRVPSGPPAAPAAGPTDPNRKIYADFHGRQLQTEEADTARSAGRILEILFRYYRPRSVLDVGCGLGTWLKVAEALGVREIRGLEGHGLDPARLVIDPAAVQLTELEQGFDCGRRFDLAICLEVGAHLAEAAAPGLIAALTRHAPAVLFSAAIPYQGAHPHANERFLSYWAVLFARFGFRPLDVIRGEIWDDPAVLWWLRQNVVLFAHDELIAANEGLQRQSTAAAAPHPLSLVHPELYLDRLQRARQQLDELDRLRQLFGRGGLFRVSLDPQGKMTVSKAE